jgi:exosortase
MRVNAEIAANLVAFVGIPAEARGNVIEVPTGLLGVDEACSGIRSLQSTLMAAAFLGLLYRRTLFGIFGLVALGSIIAFVCNIVRTTFLTYQGAVNGIEAVDKWHDTAGFTILGVVLVCLWAMSQWLERAERKGLKVET